MTYQEEMYAHLVHGGDPQVLLDAFMKDLNEAQKKADAQLEKEKQEAVKKAADKEIKAKKEEARKAAIAAAQAYYALVCPEFDVNKLEDLAKTAIDSVPKAIELWKPLKDVTITYNGRPFSIFEL